MGEVMAVDDSFAVMKVAASMTINRRLDVGTARTATTMVCVGTSMAIMTLRTKNALSAARARR